jgi:hypothetical protein
MSSSNPVTKKKTKKKQKKRAMIRLLMKKKKRFLVRSFSFSSVMAGNHPCISHGACRECAFVVPLQTIGTPSNACQYFTRLLP